MDTRAEVENPQNRIATAHKDMAVSLAGFADIVLQDVPRRLSVFPNSPNKYEHAGLALYTRFASQIPDERFHSTGVEHGFRVCARLALWGMRAYASYTSSQKATASVKELQAILESSYTPAVTTFSSTSNGRNKVLEQAFGLTSKVMPAYEEVPFAIQPIDEQDELILIPSEQSLKLVSSEAEYQERDGEPLMSRCPASGHMLRRVWAATIETCATNTDLFPYDVGVMNGLIYKLDDYNQV